MARESSSGDRPRRFLKRHLLVVAVDGLRAKRSSVLSPRHLETRERTCSELTVNGPLDVHPLQKLILISALASW